MSYVTPWTGGLDEGTYEIEMPSNIIDGGNTYNFDQWEDGSTNPIRQINLTSGLSLNASYLIQEVTALDVHAFKGAEEVNADGLIVETVYNFTTPELIIVEPGRYTVRLTLGDSSYEEIVDVQVNQTIRIDGQLITPKVPVSSFILLPAALLIIYILLRGRK